MREHTCRAILYYTRQHSTETAAAPIHPNASRMALYCVHTLLIWFRPRHDSQSPFRSFCLVSTYLVLTSFRAYFLFLLVSTTLTADSTVHRHRCYTLIYSTISHERLRVARITQLGYEFCNIPPIEIKCLECALIREKCVLKLLIK